MSGEMEAPYQMHVCARCGIRPKIIHKIMPEDFLDMENFKELTRGKYQAICTCCMTNVSIRNADLFEILKDWNEKNPEKR